MILKYNFFKNSSLLLLFAIVTSCKTVYINKQSHRIAASALELATIGETRPNLQINNFEISSIPKFNQKIRLSKIIIPFNKATFKAYSKSAALQGKINGLQYVDSASNKPTYITFKIADKVAVLNELKSESNTAVLEYLKTVPKANIVITISMVFDSSIIIDIKKAEELYLINSKYKKYDLVLYKDKKLFKTIELSKGTTFSYKLASFCWGENKRHQPELLNIIDENARCNNNTFGSFQQVKKNRSTLKY